MESNGAPESLLDDPGIVAPSSVLLSCAISLDGYLDAPGPRPLTISSERDGDAVDALRAAADVVLVGAGTVRRDDPSLTVRHPARRRARVMSGRPANPLRAVVTSSGDLGVWPKVLRDNAAETLVYACGSPVTLPSTHATCITLARRGFLARVLADLGSRGARRILVEGGQQVSSTLLGSGLIGGARIATGPLLVGGRSAPRIGGRSRVRSVVATGLRPTRSETLGDTAVVWWSAAGTEIDGLWAPQTDAEWLAEAVALSRWCPETDRAFNVGAVIARPGSPAVSTGFSRESAPHEHAEEHAIASARSACRDLKGWTLYSSMEPCSVRLSARKPCVDRIIEAGIRRVVFALPEPPVFVRCTGEADLARRGVEVVHIPELAEFAADANAGVTAVQPDRPSA